MKRKLTAVLVALAASLGGGIYLLQQKWGQPNQPHVELTKSLRTQQEELVKATREAGGDVPAMRQSSRHRSA